MSKDYTTDDQIPHTDIFEYFQKCFNAALAIELGAIIDRGNYGADVVGATLAGMIAAVLDASHQSTDDVLNKAGWLSHFTTVTVGASRAIRDAMEESKNAAHH
jgi:hypothetical protein